MRIGRAVCEAPDPVQRSMNAAIISSEAARIGFNNKAKLTLRKAYGFRE
jgi:hypothetical protein